MPSTVAAQRGHIGGLRRAALAESPQSITEAARKARSEKYRAQVREARPEITDEAEIDRRAQLLLRADMAALSLKAAKARRLKAEAARLEEEIASTDQDA